MNHAITADKVKSARVNQATQKANTETLLTPRFYTTDFDAFDKLDLEPVREEWDALMQEFENDANSNHFERDESFQSEIKPMSKELEEEFLGFMISSVTSEYSGHVLYRDIARKVDNPDVKQVMNYMARDESRHAGFINYALRDFGHPVNLMFLQKAKKYKFFKPKYIFYATYLSEKIGYARYITIYRQLEANPERRFHPLFRWFEDWCNDEYRHGEVLALIMKADPKLQRGYNKLWIRFFLLAVYATMYVRDHTRPYMHEAMGFEATDYDHQVFDITTEISKQIFPLSLDTHNPAFRRGLDRLVKISAAADAAKAKGGLIGAIKRVGCSIAGAAVFLRLYTIKTKKHELPEKVLKAPAW